MPGDNSRVARAGDYILGLMSDAERERAERDLEVDTAFRDTVMQMAERMRVFDRAAPENERPDDRWKLIAGRISELPQMREARLDEGLMPTTGVTPYRPVGMGLHVLSHRRPLVIAFGLIVAFTLGYLTGRF